MVDPAVVRRGYDRLAETYAAERSGAGPEVELVERFLDSLSAGAQVLDVGCGGGTPVLDRPGDDATHVGVDLSREQVKRAADSLPGTALLQGDARDLPIRDGAVDAVTALHSIIHVPIDAHRRVVAEFARVLRPGGSVLLSEGTGAWTGANPDWLGSGVEMQWEIAGSAATRDHLRTAGFAIDEERRVTDDLGDEESAWVFFSATLDA